MIRGLRIAAQGTQLIIPTAYTFVAERFLLNHSSVLELLIMISTPSSQVDICQKAITFMRRLSDSDAFFRADRCS